MVVLCRRGKIAGIKSPNRIAQSASLRIDSVSELASIGRRRQQQDARTAVTYITVERIQLIPIRLPFLQSVLHYRQSQFVNSRR